MKEEIIEKIKQIDDEKFFVFLLSILDGYKKNEQLARFLFCYFFCYFFNDF